MELKPSWMELCKSEKVPHWVIKAVMSRLSGCNGIWWYAEAKSVVEKTVAPRRLQNNSSMCGKGWQSQTITLFRSLKSTHIRGFPPPLLCITTTGETQGDGSMRSIMPFSCRSWSSSKTACLTENWSLLNFCCTGTALGIICILWTKPVAQPIPWMWTSRTLCGPIPNADDPFCRVVVSWRLVGMVRMSTCNDAFSLNFHF